MSFSVHGALRQTSFPISCVLIVHAMLQGFERVRLVDHLRNRTYFFEVGAVPSYSVNADVSDKEHAHFAFGLGFRPKQPCQHIDILFPGFDDRHWLTSLAF
jgi:hypothetical protein